METLELRKTHRYVGSYRHLDTWEPVGVVRCLSTHVLDLDESDPCEPMQHTHIVCVEVERGNRQDDVINALRDHYTVAGCHHEHDCCGCRSFHVRDVRPAPGGRYEVEVHSTRNL